jgi:hypothetical protein
MDLTGGTTRRRRQYGGPRAGDSAIDGSSGGGIDLGGILNGLGGLFGGKKYPAHGDAPGPVSGQSSRIGKHTCVTQALGRASVPGRSDRC